METFNFKIDLKRARKYFIFSIIFFFFFFWRVIHCMVLFSISSIRYPQIVSRLLNILLLIVDGGISIGVFKLVICARWNFVCWYLFLWNFRFFFFCFILLVIIFCAGFNGKSCFSYYTLLYLLIVVLIHQRVCLLSPNEIGFLFR